MHQIMLRDLSVCNDKLCPLLYKTRTDDYDDSGRIMFSLASVPFCDLFVLTSETDAFMILLQMVTIPQSGSHDISCEL